MVYVLEDADIIRNKLKLIKKKRKITNFYPFTINFYKEIAKKEGFVVRVENGILYLERKDI